MEITHFRSVVKPGTKLLIEQKELIVREVIKFVFDDQSFYYKCFLSDDLVFADDEEANVYLLVKEVKTHIKTPFPKQLKYDEKEFKFLYTAHAVAQEVWGEAIIQKGMAESFWDYLGDDGSYLSLGIKDLTNEKLDFYGKVVNLKDVGIK